MKKLPDKVICDHCGYTCAKGMMREDERQWLCPACGLCNTSYQLENGVRTQLGYQRHMEINYE